MNLTPPTRNVFWLSVVAVGLGVLGVFVEIPFVSDNPYWFMVGGYGLLVLGNMMKGL
jgi:hypothetical protein